MAEEMNMNDKALLENLTRTLIRWARYIERDEAPVTSTEIAQRAIAVFTEACLRLQRKYEA